MMKNQKLQKRNNLSLYVHIPFCNSICSYCDFCKVFYDERLVLPYLNKLETELKSYKINEFKTIYIGGGTPSSLSLNQLKRLLEILKPYSKKVIEYDFEANPESLSKDKIFLLKKYGINRISLGVQSLNPLILKDINRNHTYEDVTKVISCLNVAGITNYNFDLIVGLPNQTLDDIKCDLNHMIALKPKHMSIYSLTINENTIFFNKGIKEVDDCTSRKQLDLVDSILVSNGFIHYEVSNFCLENYESKHNIVYWKDNEYIGIGAGAASFLNGKRYQNTKSIFNYIKNDKLIVEEETVTKEDDINYFIMLNLRLKEGFNDLDFIKKYGFSFIDKYRDKLKKLIDDKLITINNNQIKTTYNGLMLLDRILIELF